MFHKGKYGYSYFVPVSLSVFVREDLKKLIAFILYTFFHIHSFMPLSNRISWKGMHFMYVAKVSFKGTVFKFYTFYASPNTSIS